MSGISSKFNGKKGGRPKGTKNPETLEKEATLAAYRQLGMKNAERIFYSQLHLTLGQQFLYKIEKEFVPNKKGSGGFYRNKRPKLVTKEEEIRTHLDGAIKNGDMDDDYDPAATYYFITTKESVYQAGDSILDRTYGKATQITELTGKDGKDLIPDSDSKAKTDKAIVGYLKKNGNN